MAAFCSSRAPPTLETLTRSIEECGIVDDGRPLHFLMIGPPGVGKSSLAGVLINGVSKGVDGPDAGTTENIKSTEVRANNESTYIVHDTRGLDGNEEQTQQTIDEMKRIIINEKCIVFVCVRWDARFSDCKTTFEVTNQLSPDIWEKSIIALTHSDRLSFDVTELQDDQQAQRIEELNENWKRSIKAELLNLGVNEDTLDKLKICNTSHTSKSSYSYPIKWLKELMVNFLKVLPHHKDVVYTILSQVANLYPKHKELVDSLISSIHDKDISPVHDTLQNIPPESSTRVSNCERVYNALRTIGGGVSGAVVVGGLGVAAGSLLCSYGCIAASVVIGACIGGAIGAGIGLIGGITIVCIYVFYKKNSKND